MEIEKRIEIEKLLAIKAEEDLFSYIAIMWNQLGGKDQFKKTWHSEAICDHLMALYNKDIRKLLISISPRKGKSILCSVGFPTWLWIKDANSQILSASYGSGLATRDAVRSRDTISSPFYQKYWSDRFKLSSDQNQKTRYSNNKGGYRLTTSVDGAGTGEGCDYLIIDDPHKADEGSSPTKLQSTVDWYYNTISSRWNNPNTWCQMIIHQRVAKKDLIGSIIENEGEEWEILKLPEEYIPTTYITRIGWKDPRKEKGEILAPELLNEEQLRGEKRKGKFRWWSQFQQEPGVEEGNYINEEQLKYYEYKPDKKYIQYAVLSIDPTFGSITETASYAVTQLWINIHNNINPHNITKIVNEWRLYDQFRKRCSFPDHLANIKSYIREYEIDYILLEDKANGKALYDILQTYDQKDCKYFTEKYKEERIILMKPNEYGDKEQRYGVAVEDFNENSDTRIIIPDPNKFKEGLVIKEELLQFPRYGSDDIVDAYSQFSIWLRKNKKELYQKTNKEYLREEEYNELFDLDKIGRSRNNINNEIDELYNYFDNNIDDVIALF